MDVKKNAFNKHCVSKNNSTVLCERSMSINYFKTFISGMLYKRIQLSIKFSSDFEQLSGKADGEIVLDPFQSSIRATFY